MRDRRRTVKGKMENEAQETGVAQNVVGEMDTSLEATN